VQTHRKGKLEDMIYERRVHGPVLFEEFHENGSDEVKIIIEIGSNQLESRENSLREFVVQTVV
jgi:hypothetical protein